MVLRQGPVQPGNGIEPPEAIQCRAFREGHVDGSDLSFLFTLVTSGIIVANVPTVAGPIIWFLAVAHHSVRDAAAASCPRQREPGRSRDRQALRCERRFTVTAAIENHLVLGTEPDGENHFLGVQRRNV